MCRIYFLILLVSYFGILINCQGHGGGGGGSGHSSSGRGSKCDIPGCIYTCAVASASVIGTIAFLWYKIRKGRPRENNVTFVNANSEQQTYEMQRMCQNNIFLPGIWLSRYYQYDEWHGPHKSTLSFDQKSKGIRGSGWDDVGSFTIDGTYSDVTRRIGLTKHYQRGTGNSRENRGHKVIIQLVYNQQEDQFEGRWYIKCIGDEKFVLARSYEQV